MSSVSTDMEAEVWAGAVLLEAPAGLAESLVPWPMHPLALSLRRAPC